jgi:hemerythrin-like domain-containing protein
MDISDVVAGAKKIISGAKEAAGAPLTKVAGTAAAVTVPPHPTIFDLLEDDHEEFRQLMKKIATTTTRGVKLRAALFNQLKLVVTAHARAEEAVLYETMKAKQPTRGEVLEGFEEHHVTDMIFAELAKTAPSDERWTAKMSVLCEGLRHHIDEEERELFADSRKKMSKQQMQKLGEEFAKEKARQLAKLAPKPKRVAK